MAKTLGLHAAADRLDAVLLQATGAKATVLAAFSAAWPKPLAVEHAAELGAWLKKELADRGMAGDAAVALGRGLASCRTLQVPECPVEELPGMVRFAAEGQSDGAAEVLDFHAGGLRQGQRDVTLAAAQAGPLAALQAVAKAAGLRLARAEPRAYGLRWLRERLAEGDPQRAELLAAAGPNGGDAAVWHAGRLDLQRPLPGGADNAARLAGELRRTVVAFEALDGPTPQGVVLLAAPNGALAAAAQNLGLPVLAVDPAAAVPGLAEHGAELAAVGAAWRLAAGVAAPIDLLKPKKPVEQGASRMRLAGLAAGLAAVALLALYLQAQRGLRSLDAEAGEMARELEGIRQKVERGKPERDRHAAVKAWVAGQVDWLAEIAQLSKLLPDTQDAIVGRLVAETTTASGKSDSMLKFSVLIKNPELVEELDGLDQKYKLRPVQHKPLNEANKVFVAEETYELELVKAEESAAAGKAAKAPPPAAAPEKHDANLAKAGKRRVPASFGQPAGLAASASPGKAAAPGVAASTNAKRDRTDRTERNNSRTARPGSEPSPAGGPPPMGISAASAATGSAEPDPASPEAALDAKVKRLADLSYSDREQELAKEKSLFRNALRKRIEAYLEKNKK